MTQDFSQCKMEYGKDSMGKEVLLKDGKFQVMMEWEKPYMQACIDALKPFGDVLEIGFGLAYSAERIQSFHPKSHTIIEFHPEVAKRAREWAKQYPHVTIIEDTWQNALPNLGVFDAIFFDDYPLESEEEMKKMQEESTHSHLLLGEASHLLKSVEQTLPFLPTIKYSDEDVACLIAQIPSDQKEPHLQLVRFLEELCQGQQITQSQLDKGLALLVKEKRMSGEEVQACLKKTEEIKPFAFAGTGDRLFRFLSSCLKAHMRNGSRFSCFLSSPTSKYEDDRFVSEIIANPFLDFHEEEIKVEIPDNCRYFSGNKALVIIIIKRTDSI